MTTEYVTAVLNLPSLGVGVICHSIGLHSILFFFFSSLAIHYFIPISITFCVAISLIL